MAYLIANEKNTPIEETPINSAAIAISQILNGDKVTEEIKGMPLSADTIPRCIGEMGQDF